MTLAAGGCRTVSCLTLADFQDKALLAHKSVTLDLLRRFCAGYAVAMAEMKAFLALLARGYDFEADVDTAWVQRIGRVPANGLPMRVSRLRD